MCFIRVLIASICINFLYQGKNVGSVHLQFWGGTDVHINKEEKIGLTFDRMVKMWGGIDAHIDKKGNIWINL